MNKLLSFVTHSQVIISAEVSPFFLFTCSLVSSLMSCLFLQASNFNPATYRCLVHPSGADYMHLYVSFLEAVQQECQQMILPTGISRKFIPKYYKLCQNNCKICTSKTALKMFVSVTQRDSGSIKPSENSRSSQRDKHPALGCPQWLE